MRDPSSEYEKVPYARSQKKRYEISRDSFSKKRIETVRAVYKELSAILPISLSISLVGSLLKGKELRTQEIADNTDIDLFVHLDGEELSNLQSSPEKLDALEKILGIEITEIDRLVKSKLVHFVYDYIKSYIEKEKEGLGYKKEAKLDIGVDLADRYTIERAVRAVGMVNYGIHFNFANVEDYVVEAYITLASYFLPAAGGVSKKYRQRFLIKLSESNENEAEKTWGTIRQVIYRVEDASWMPQKLTERMPFHFKDALKFYGTDLFSQQTDSHIAPNSSL